MKFKILIFVLLVLLLKVAIGTKREVVQLKIFQSKSLQDEFHISMDTLSENISLKFVKPVDSIFTSNFKMYNGPEIDHELTNRTIESVHRSLYIHQKSASVVNLQQDHSGNHILQDGVINNYLVKNENGVYFATKQAEKLPLKDDYIDLGRNISISSKMEFNYQMTELNPEVYFTCDKKFAEIAGSSWTSYIARIFMSVNLRFGNYYTPNPKIKFKIAGGLSPHEFVWNETDRCKTPDRSGYNMDTLLPAFSRGMKKIWDIFNKNDYPDIAAFFSGEDLQKIENGVFSKSYLGQAYLNGACFYTPNQVMNTMIVEDMSATYESITTFAHELAHSLGSVHDGEPGMTDCPPSEGYIMSYQGYGNKNKFFFSKCAQDKMNQFIRTPAANCLRVENYRSKSPIDATIFNSVVPRPFQNGGDPGYPGDSMTLNEACKKKTKDPSAFYINTEPAKLCKVLSCQHRSASGQSFITSYNINQALDDAPCGNGGKCWNGECILQNRN